MKDARSSKYRCERRFVPTQIEVVRTIKSGLNEGGGGLGGGGGGGGEVRKKMKQKP
jgi:hypothetical protein